MKEVKIGDHIHADIHDQYVAIDIMDIKRFLFGYKYWCRYRSEFGIHLIWLPYKKLIIHN